MSVCVGDSVSATGRLKMERLPICTVGVGLDGKGHCIEDVPTPVRLASADPRLFQEGSLDLGTLPGSVHKSNCPT